MPGTQRLPGTFRGKVGGSGSIGTLNIADQFALSVSSASYTTGATLIDTLQVQPALTEKWTIQAWQIAFDLWFFRNGSTPASGRLGQILAGLIVNANPTVGKANNGTFSDTPLGTLPPDLSLLEIIWDGSTDPAPPAFFSTLPPSVPIVKNTVLSTPLTLLSGENLSIGIWLKPSLIEGGVLEIANATYAIQYDTA